MKYYDNKRIIITGGAGFLGSHLCKRLVGKGYEVLCVDNCFTGTRKNIAGLLSNGSNNKDERTRRHQYAGTG